MAHYVCPVCRESGENAGFCQTADCAGYGEELKECSCEDGEHKEVVGEEGVETQDDVSEGAAKF